jgi:hypothetical protein
MREDAAVAATVRAITTGRRRRGGTCTDRWIALLVPNLIMVGRAWLR